LFARKGWRLTGIVTRHGLTDRQAVYVERIVSGFEPREAAKAAGFHPAYAHKAMRVPAISLAIEREVRRILTDEAAPLALRTALVLVRKGSDRVRADLAVKLLAMAGFGPRDAGAADEKQLAEMSAAELRAYIERNHAEYERLEAELASRAKLVDAPDSAQIAPPAPSNSLDYLD
jgi:hypothetical protein